MNLGSNPIACLLAASLLLSGCASAPRHLTEENRKEIKNIAIISLVPESVNFEKIGIISFANEYTGFDMGGKVSNSIVSATRERIGESQPDWAVKSIAYDRTALLATVKTVAGFRTARAKEAFAALARENNLDALFVVRANPDEDNNLLEGLNVLLLDNNLDRSRKLAIRASLNVGIIDKNGEVLAVGEVPARLNNFGTLDPENYGLKNKLINNGPEVLGKLGDEAIAETTTRLKLCLDSLGFPGKPGSEAQQPIPVVQKPDAVTKPAEKAPVEAAPAENSFDQCFSRCRQYTDRTKEQCFDACNK